MIGAGAAAGQQAPVVGGGPRPAIPAPNANDYLGGLTSTGQDLQAEAAAKKAEQEALAQVEAEERAGGPVVDGEVVEVDGRAVPAERADDGTSAGSDDAPAKPADKPGDKPAQPQDFSSIAEQMTESMNQSMKIMMYLFPFFPIVGAYFFNFPIAIGLYWLTNNIWTAVQSHFFMEKLEKELPMTSREGLPPSAFM